MARSLPVLGLAVVLTSCSPPPRAPVAVATPGQEEDSGPRADETAATSTAGRSTAAASRRSPEEPPETLRGRDAWIESFVCPDGAIVRELEHGRVGCARDDGERHGVVTHWRNDGLVEWYVFRDGVQHGPAARYHSSGQMAWRTGFENGRREGEDRHWHASGEVFIVRHFRDDELHGLEKRWHPNGQLMSETHYERGEPTGTSVTYYDSGGKEAQVNHLGDGRSTYVKWHENGTRREEGGNFRHWRSGTCRWWNDDGQLSRVEEYTPGGGLRSITVYENGKVVDRQRFRPPRPPAPPPSPRRDGT